MKNECYATGRCDLLVNLAEGSDIYYFYMPAPRNEEQYKTTITERCRLSTSIFHNEKRLD